MTLFQDCHVIAPRLCYMSLFESSKNAVHYGSASATIVVEEASSTWVLKVERLLTKNNE